jgi:hypothetical protein
MGTVSTLGAATFIVAWSFVVLAMLYAVVESIAAWRFARWPFKLGPRVFRMRVALPRPRSAVGANDVITTASGRWKILGPDLCLFRPHVPLFGRGVRTAYERHATVRWEASHANIEGRLPLSSILVGATWLATATIWCIIALPSPEFHTVAPLALLGSWAFVGLLTWWGIWFELRRARRIVEEFRRALARAAA